MKNIFVVDIEPLDNRYTKQWFTEVPKQLNNRFDGKANIIVISGLLNAEYTAPQPGAFFDFALSCKYKSEQSQKIAELFSDGTVKPGDIFLFTDAWHPAVHTVRYLSELNHIPVKCAGIWHAGYYDKTDILGMFIVRRQWIENLEKSMAFAYDLSFFATEQHKTKMTRSYPKLKYNKDLVVCGQPYDYLSSLQNNEKKENIVVFPHRLNSDKNPWFFDDIADIVNKTRPDISFIKTQRLNLNKASYYRLLSNAKVVFSCSDHENLGVGTYEAVLSGCLPLLPNKLSYKEIYSPDFLYNGPFVNTRRVTNKMTRYLADMVVDLVDSYYDPKWQSLRAYDIKRSQKFFSSQDMLDRLERL